MTETLTVSIQDYLKAIYELTRSGEAATTNGLAGRLGVEPASVTGMIQKLAATRPALVTYRKHRGVKLTTAGLRAALEVIRHHRLLEAWLVKSLGYSWDEVHPEAERLEHVISEEFEQRMAAALGEPLRDPHGDLIPSPDLVMPADQSVPLASLPAGRKAIVRRVDGQDQTLLRRLEELELIPGTVVEVLRLSEIDNIMYIRLQGRTDTSVLGPAVTSRVFVETV
ncbi:MAG TPA: metal-dependent transcriptional regulator [Anaerolineales bacterium]